VRETNQWGRHKETAIEIEERGKTGGIYPFFRGLTEEFRK